MTPRPPSTLRSAHDTGQGLAMSNARNMTNPAATSQIERGSHSKGSSAIHCPTNSSHTNAPGSSIRNVRTAQSQAQMPSAKAATTTSTYHGQGSSHSASQGSNATSEPALPGAM